MFSAEGPRSRTVSNRKAERRRAARRRGVAAVELALISPLLALIICGMFELSRALLVKQALNDAAYKGCEIGASPLSDNAAIIAAIKGVLSDNQISSTAATVAVQV